MFNCMGGEWGKNRKTSCRYWSWREESNLQPVVYKSDEAQPEPTQEDLSEGKNKDPEQP